MGRVRVRVRASDEVWLSTVKRSAQCEGVTGAGAATALSLMAASLAARRRRGERRALSGRREPSSRPRPLRRLAATGAGALAALAAAATLAALAAAVVLWVCTVR